MTMQKSSKKESPNSELIRIHVFLAHSGVASRRRAEALVMQGKVKVNRVTAVVGQQINPQSDKVSVDGKTISSTSKSVYILLHKPPGVVSTTNDDLGRPTVLSLLPKALMQQIGRLYPVGRLDIESEGLLLLTNDGALAQQLTHPKYEVKKTYHVQLDRQPSEKALLHLQKGVLLKDGMARVDNFEPLPDEYQKDQVWYSVSVHEGRNRLVRRLWERLGYDVLRLIRTSFGPFSITQLGEKRWIKIEPKIFV